MTCIPNLIDEHSAIPVPAAELRALRESNAELLAALQAIDHATNGPWDGAEQIQHEAHAWKLIRAALAKAAPDFHDDRPDGRPDLHVPTQPGDLTTYGSPLKPGR